MAGGEKLYPPIIGDSIPAFYEESGTAKIAVPFSLNRAVSPNQIGGFVIKIKTVQSNVLKKTIKSTNSSMIATSLGSYVANFVWEDFNAATAGISMGQYFKIQIAFIDITHTVVGYFSNVGIIKFTAKPSVYILNAEPKTPNAIELFKMSYVGVYEPSPDDTSERPYSYCFNLYNSDRMLVESSDWQLHNSSINYLVEESLSLNATMDQYSFKTALIPNEQYYIQYTVRTINNLEIESILYSCVDLPIEASTLPIRLVSENNFENGYIDVHFDSNQHRYQKISFSDFTSSDLFQNMLILWANGQFDFYTEEELASNFIIYLVDGISVNRFEDLSPFTWNSSNYGNELSNLSNLYNFLKGFKLNENATNINTQEMKQRVVNYNQYKNKIVKWLSEYINYTESDKNNLALANPVSFIIERSDAAHNYENWVTMKRVYFTSYLELLSWSLKDFTIEQGQYYKYAMRQYNAENIMTERTLSNDGEPVMGDFEDMYLYDGKKQIRIRYNPKITSFKETRAEQKIETLGSQFPFIFRNGIINYKEFPISGLISYLADENELFVNYKKDLNIDPGESYIRDGTPSVKSRIENNLQVATTSVAESYNVYAERQFKTLLLDWLNNGEIKLFRSATEGNYIVRLMNVSMAPEDKTGRLLHTFTAQACEIAEYTMSNLVSLGFMELNDYKLDTLYTKTIQVYNHLSDSMQNNVSIGTSFLINKGDKIVNHLIISPTENTSDGFGLVLRIGADSPTKKTYVLPGHELNLSLDNAVLPDIYFNALDNLEIINNILNDRYPTHTAAFTSSAKYNTSVTINTTPIESVTLKAMVQQLLNNLTITYSCYTSEYLVGKLGHIDTVYIENVIETLNGPGHLEADSLEPIPLEGTGTSSQLLRYVMLNFYEKPIIDLTKIGSNYYIENDGTISRLNSGSWSELGIYRISQQNQMNLTSDTAVNTNKNYYTRIENNDLYYYKLTKLSKNANPSSGGYYEASNQTYYSGKTKGTISSLQYTIDLTLEDGTTSSITEAPLIVNSGHLYRYIGIGNAVYAQVAYQRRVVKYK